MHLRSTVALDLAIYKENRTDPVLGELARLGSVQPPGQACAAAIHVDRYEVGICKQYRVYAGHAIISS